MSVSREEQWKTLAAGPTADASHFLPLKPKHFRLILSVLLTDRPFASHKISICQPRVLVSDRGKEKDRSTRHPTCITSSRFRFEPTKVVMKSPHQSYFYGLFVLVLLILVSQQNHGALLAFGVSKALAGVAFPPGSISRCIYPSGEKARNADSPHRKIMQAICRVISIIQQSTSPTSPSLFK